MGLKAFKTMLFWQVEFMGTPPYVHWYLYMPGRKHPYCAKANGRRQNMPM